MPNAILLHKAARHNRLRSCLPCHCKQAVRLENAYLQDYLDNVTVIGSNTAGDGIGTGSLCSSLVFRSYMFAQIMPESKLIFFYTLQISLNEKGEINEIFGTPPDIYAENDDEAVKIFSEIAEETGAPYSPYSYESRRKWDKVMNTAVSLITGDELS